LGGAKWRPRRGKRKHDKKKVFGKKGGGKVGFLRKKTKNSEKPWERSGLLEDCELYKC